MLYDAILPNSGTKANFNTATLKWTVPGTGGNKVLGNGVGAITWSNALPVHDAEQLNLFIQTANGGSSTLLTAAVVQLQWSADGTNFANEPEIEQGALAATERRFTVNDRAWGPRTTSWWIFVPVAAHFVRIGVYANGAPDANDQVSIAVERQRGYQLQQGV